MAKKVKENTVEYKLRTLYSLQLIDSRLDEIRNTRGELPLEVEDLEDDIVGLNTKVDKIKTEISVLEGSINEKKTGIKDAEASIKKYNKQQDSVRNNREFEALSKEVEFQELEMQLLEKNIKELGAKIDHKNELIEGLNEKIESLSSHLAHKVSELDVIVKETEAEEKFLVNKSEEQEKSIEERLLKAYKKIRGSVKNGLAVVPVERGASSGSYFTIPLQIQAEIAQRKKIMTDEHSGRILIDIEMAMEEKEKMNEVFSGV